MTKKRPLTHSCQMMKNFILLMWHEKEGDTIHLDGKGMILRPKLEELNSSLKDEYKGLINWINELIK